MREIQAELLTSTVAQMCIRANYDLPCDVLRQLQSAQAEEPWPAAQEIMRQILENAELAAANAQPICQDTGMACVFLEIGQEVHIAGDLKAAVQEGVRRGYAEGYLRKSVVRDPLRRGNTGDNTPATIYLRLVPGDRLRLTVAPKGAGSENMCAVKMLTPAEGEEPAPVMDWETVGVKAVDDYTLQYTLKNPVPYFLSMTTYVAFMPVNETFLNEMGANFGVATGNDTILYCGAYILSEFAPQEKRVLTKNESNWDADNVFIERIEQTYNKEASTISPELYRRGEIDSASIDSTLAADWLADPETADLIRPVRQSGFYTYFYAFNFDPHFDEQYEPENWKIAVNNENFRKSIFHALDKISAALPYEPDYPETILFDTITPPAFVSLHGEDYTDMGALGEVTAAAQFDEAKALEYKELAIAELTEAGATFPVKIYMPYNPSVTGWDEECQVIEQQMEGLLGTDYIDIIIEAGPTTGFLDAVRRNGNFAIHKCNWGPDYADPNTYTDPFYDGTYNKPEMALYYNNEEGYSEYYALVDAARAITDDLQARYEAFAEAEAFLIEHAFVIPFGFGSGGYDPNRLNPFESQYAPFGLSGERYKGQKVYEVPMNTDDYFEAMDAWEAERAALAAQEE